MRMNEKTTIKVLLSLIDQLKLSFCGIHHPPVWIRIEADSKTTFKELHEIIQAAYQWLDLTPHYFEMPSPSYRSVRGGIPVDLKAFTRFAITHLVPTVQICPDYSEFGDPPGDDYWDEAGCALDRFLKKIGDKEIYYYNDEAYWEINVRLEARHRQEKGTVYPQCIKVSRGFVDLMTGQGEWSQDTRDEGPDDFTEMSPQAWVTTINQELRELKSNE